MDNLEYPWVGLWEGVTAVYPMWRDKKSQLSWQIEHHGRNSRGGYVVEMDGECRVFHQLEDAVNYMRKGRAFENR